MFLYITAVSGQVSDSHNHMALINSLQTYQSSLKPDYIWNEQDFLFHEMKLNTKIIYYYLLVLKKLSTNAQSMHVQKNYYLYLTFYFLDSHVILKICQCH